MEDLEAVKDVETRLNERIVKFVCRIVSFQASVSEMKFEFQTSRDVV